MDETANPMPGPDDLGGIAPDNAPSDDPHVVGAVLHSHSERIAAQDTRLDELEAEVARLGEAIANGANRSTKPAKDGDTPASLAKDPETGMQPGHAGAGTGDGPAGYRP